MFVQLVRRLCPTRDPSEKKKKKSDSRFCLRVRLLKRENQEKRITNNNNVRTFPPIWNTKTNTTAVGMPTR